jgi:hypothetical protein
MPNKKTTAPLTVYQPVGPNIYFDGNSYRVRAIVNGTRYSKSLTSKRKAVQYRNSLLKNA